MSKFEQPPIPEKQSLEEKSGGETIPTESAEQVLPSKPELRYLDRAFDIIRASEKNPLGGEINWRGLSEKIKPFENGLEFSDNIREVVTEFISQKIPVLKEEIPSLEDLDDKKFLEALAHNWFSAIGEEVDGKRREVLLATMAHVVKRIENYTYKKALGEMPPTDLEKLGLDPDTRDLLVQVLDTSIKADPMYIRFLAYSRLTPTPPEKSGPVTFSLPGHEKLYTTATFFPHEAQFLAKRFGKIAENHENGAVNPG